MRNETRTLFLDPDLNVEAYRFKGIIQKFPNHFHEYFVIGFIEKGQRYLLCKGEEYIINQGDLVLFMGSPPLSLDLRSFSLMDK